MEASLELAKIHGAYETFQGSPLSEGLFQFDLNSYDNDLLMYKDEWRLLRNEIKEHGVRNSLLVAPMPTASTSQIMGNNECIEPYTSNVYVRRTLAGEFIVINKHLVKMLKDNNMWSKDQKDQLIRTKGVYTGRNREIFRTVWEISQKELIEQASDRQNFICQSQSLNLFMTKPDVRKLTSMHFYAHSKGLKTGMYYLRTQPASDPIQFTCSARKECEMCSG